MNQEEQNAIQEIQKYVSFASKLEYYDKVLGTMVDTMQDEDVSTGNKLEIVHAMTSVAIAKLVHDNAALTAQVDSLEASLGSLTNRVLGMGVHPND